MMGRACHFATRVTIIALALSAVLAGGIYIQMRRSLPDYTGIVRTQRVAGPVRIVRDAHAVPHIEAQTLEDALFALGYAHAQDRLWQMTLARRLGEGRLAELIGTKGLPFDRNTRALDLPAIARTSFASLSPPAKSALESYADGINHVITNRDRPLPPEYFLTHSSPEPWQAEDSILLLTMLGLGASENAMRELSRMDLAGKLSREDLAAFMAPYPGLPEDFDLDDLLASIAPAKTGSRLAKTFLGPHGASNNWVADGTRTASGAPLMANDPHLALTMPGLWYLAHLSYGGRNIIGATLPGIPAILLGHNNDVAWSLTSTGADVQDLVLERVNPDNLNAYMTPDGPRAFDSRRETIRVRFGKDHTEALRATRNGPLLPLLQGRAPPGYVFALKWSALNPRNRTYEAAFAMLETGTVEEARDALRNFQAPVQNVLLADRHGAIAFLVAGAVPFRTEGDGTVPVAGWRHREIWSGLVPPAELPSTLNPEKGILYTANHDIRPTGYEALITLDWHEDGRATRIDKLLTGTGHDIRRYESMQLDARSRLRDTLLPLMLRQTERNAETGPVLDLLSRWDGSMAVDDVAPTVFMAWLKHLMPMIAGDELEDLADEFSEPRPAFLIRVLSDRDTHWCDEKISPQTESCRDFLTRSLKNALKELTATLGPIGTRWGWGKSHMAIHTHAPFGFLPVLREFFSRKVASPGGGDTLNRGSFHWTGAAPFANVHGAGYRGIYDLADPSRSRYMIATGQSGHVLSPYYDDLMKPWAKGQYLPMTTNRNEYEEGAAGMLTLMPSS